MTRSTRQNALAPRLGALALALLAAVLPAQDKKPRVIVLGFDGVDHALTERYMAAGELPNLKALAERGSFSRLETTNPAESAVSWTTFGRGLLPGRTDMFGFVARKKGSYLPEVRFMKKGTAPYSRFFGAAPGWLLAGLLGGTLGGFLAGFLVARGRARLPVALMLALAGGGGGWMLASVTGGGSAKEVPTLLPVAEGTPLWDRLDAAGRRFKGFLVPMATPLAPMQHGHMTGGLGVPDVAGNPTGEYTILTTSGLDVPLGDERNTGSGARVVRLQESDGGYRARLHGPHDPARKPAVEARLGEVGKALLALDTDPAKLPALRKEKKKLEAALAAGLPSTAEVRVRRAAGAVEIGIGGQTATVAQGGWSPWLPVRFRVTWAGEVAALCRMRVLDAGDDLRLLVTPLGYDPRAIPRNMCIEQPPGYSRQLAEQAGLFDTNGWACLSNPLKDLEVGEGVFLEHIHKLTEERSRVLYSQLERDDWDLYFGMFAETDRVQHMMFRLIDSKHPMYDAELAKKYGGAILEVYKAMDRIVGEVMRRFLDDRTHLLVVSDHGFTSFRRQVDLNTWLMQQGYLVPSGGKRGAAALLASLPERDQNMLQFMDAAKTRAFALGLGKIYLNIRGREAKGIVNAASSEALAKEIAAKLLELRDPADGSRVVQRVWRRDELFHGPYAADDADLIVGFAPHYHVSWATTEGAFSAKVIEDNDNKWSGGHASNAPQAVPGVLFSSRPLEPDQKPAIVDMAPTLLSELGVDPGPTDGRVLRFR